MKIRFIINPVAGIKSNKSFVTTTGVRKIKIPSYEKMISSMVQNIKDNKDLYEQYLDKHEL